MSQSCQSLRGRDFCAPQPPDDEKWNELVPAGNKCTLCLLSEELDYVNDRHEVSAGSIKDKNMILAWRRVRSAGDSL